MTARVRDSVFQAFSWLSEDLRFDQAAEFAGGMKDLGMGIQKCLQLVEISELERMAICDNGPPADGEEADLPLLSGYDTGVLLRFAITAAGIIGEQADAFRRRAEERCSDAKQAAPAATGQGGRRG